MVAADSVAVAVAAGANDFQLVVASFDAGRNREGRGHGECACRKC